MYVVFITKQNKHKHKEEASGLAMLFTTYVCLLYLNEN